MAQGAVYTPNNQFLTFNGVPMIFSRAEGTYLTMTWVKPEQITMVVGVDSLGFYNVSKNRAAYIDLVVLVNGIENDILSAAHQAFLAAPNGLRYPLLVTQGLTEYAGLGVVTGPPPVTMSDSAMTNTWRIASLEMVGKTGSKVGAPLP
jgi:hypothetical protein